MLSSARHAEPLATHLVIPKIRQGSRRGPRLQRHIVMACAGIALHKVMLLNREPKPSAVPRRSACPGSGGRSEVREAGQQSVRICALECERADSPGGLPILSMRWPRCPGRLPQNVGALPPGCCQLVQCARHVRVWRCQVCDGTAACRHELSRSVHHANAAGSGLGMAYT